MVTPDGKEIVVNNRFRFQQQDYFKKSLLSKAASGSEYVYFQSEEYLYMYNRIGDTGITLCGMIPKTSFMKQAWEIRFSTIILVVLACLVAVTIGVIIAGGIGRNMNRINQKLNQISEGDLTVTLTVSRRDEFGILANNITDMLNNMKNLILKMVHVSSLVSDSADDVLHVSRQITDSNFQITNAVYQIGHGISEQAGDSQNCLSEMDGLSGKIAAVNENLVEIERLMEDMKRLISRGIQTMEELTKQSDATNHITKYVVDNITVLEQKTKSIGEIIQVINEISDQTNLLSINASIEAARAGDAGKGFAVVASEIRNLASKAMNSAEEIRQMIDMITRQTNDTAAAVKEAENIVSNQNKVVDNTREAFRVMNSGIEKLINILAGIGQNIINMEAAKEATLEAVESITAISGQTLASSGSIEKTVQEQACSMEVLVKEANILNDNARDLKEVVKMFRL